MANKYKIRPPFKTVNYYTQVTITDGGSARVAIVPNNVIVDVPKYAHELCAIMNENANRLCHAANGEGEARVECKRDTSRKCVDCELCGDKASDGNIKEDNNGE